MSNDILKKLNTDMAKIFTISYKEVRGNNFILLPQYYAKKKNIEESRKNTPIKSQGDRVHSLSKNESKK
jgi:hypothetical protein|tara:strand:- start:668 stop:874 length:207 start_codon:yes stop_codon:yes gene_type:complete